MSARRGQGGRITRKSRVREPHPVIRIFCEGKETEANYFEDIRAAYKIPSMFVHRVGREPGTLVADAIKFVNKEHGTVAQRAKSEEGHFWCVFDRDEHGAFDEALSKARANGLKTAVSNPCFELWYLLHFKDQNAHIKRDDAKREMENYVKGYCESTPGIYSKIKDDSETAIAKAKALRAMHPEAGRALFANPSTNVDELVELILSIAKK